MREGRSNNSTVRRSSEFRKFRDNSKRRLDLRKNRQAINNFPFNTPLAKRQLFTKKLIRSIKKRKHNTKFAKQIDGVNTSQSKLIEKRMPKKLDSSIEEGEIISDDECNHTQINIVTQIAKSSCTITASATENNDDDDCICIEPQIEQIVIDDDQPNTPATSTSKSRSKNKSNKSSGYVSLIQRITERGSQLITSTPVCSQSTNTTATQKSPQNNADCGALFYEDVSSINSQDFPRSACKEIDYTTLRFLSGGRCKKKSKFGKKGGRKNKKSNGKQKKRKGKKLDSNDIIILDEIITNDVTIKPMEIEKVEQAENAQQIDDSVIFISETVGISDKPAHMGDFVPLDSDNVPNPIFVPKSPPRPVRKAAIKSGLLFTNSEKKELVAYNNNTYNPNAGDPEAPEKQSKKRMILIDACNVAFNHALSKEFSVKGLKICIDFFEKMGHEVKAVVPQFRMHKCSDSATMFELHKAGKIVVTPCKNLPGKFSSCYDDRFILQLASEMDAAIVSNDNYRDLMNENAAFKKLIENRVLCFTWCNDVFMIAKDPYGRWGPTLQTILNRI
ncbi:NEDD4-binding protein 1-like isoform X2 [Eurosta solidaginis]